MKWVAITVLVIYWALALLALATFWMSPPDGLSNLGIVAVTLPVTLITLPILDWGLGIEFPFLPLGYYIAHTIYLLGAGLLISTVIWRLSKMRKSTAGNPPDR